jgi:hypothetical protein
MNNTRKAHQVIAEARDVLGGNGILLNFHVMPHKSTLRPSTPARHPAQRTNNTCPRELRTIDARRK